MNPILSLLSALLLALPLSAAQKAAGPAATLHGALKNPAGAFDGARLSGQAEPVPSAGGTRSLPPLAAPQPADPFQWLEETRSPRALQWAEDRNKTTVAELSADPRFAGLERDSLAIRDSVDKLAWPSIRGNWVYNFWSDAAHVRGLLRRTTLDEYRKPNPKWETVVDVDALAARENEDWVWHGSNCLEPAYERCLVTLSRGGKDAAVVREFDMRTKSFVANGFYLPEAKSRVSWVNEDEVLVGTDFGPGSLTDSSYPRIVKRWRRGTPLDQAVTVIEGDAADISVGGYVSRRPEGKRTVLSVSKSFFTSVNYVLNDDGTTVKMPFPDSSNFQGFFKGQALVTLREDWRSGSRVLPAGSLIALPESRLGAADAADHAQVVYAPGKGASLNGVVMTRDRVYLSVLNDVKGRMIEARVARGGWARKDVDLPDNGAVDIVAADSYSNRVMASYNNFLVPPTIYEIDGGKPKALKSLKASFDARDLEVEQLWATSRDGARVPYFVVKKKGLKLDGSTPTLLYGYGGFDAVMEPGYSAVRGKLWLENGGVYVLANIRGGGEFGPAWHEAAKRQNKQRSYDDFIGVAEDLIRRGITSPRRLGIQGGSNGGLLVGAVAMQRPDLFSAVLCEVPLLDMLRYTKIGAGASWADEYGDPADPAAAQWLRAYSPYHNVKPGMRYPKIFFLTSTGDDRVEPAHARKMAALMQSMGHEVLFFENTRGGHGLASDSKQWAKIDAMTYVYLLKRLAD